MRNLNELDKYRRVDWEMSIAGQPGNSVIGCFVIPSPVDHKPLHCVVSGVMGWDHVSVTHKKRIPNWTEMEYIKRMFFKDDETAMQVHVPPSEHINCHPRCLHLWRPHFQTIPKPPAEWVGPTREQMREKILNDPDLPCEAGKD